MENKRFNRGMLKPDMHKFLLQRLNENCLEEQKSTEKENVLEFLRWADEERLENLRQMSEAIC